MLIATLAVLALATAEHATLAPAGQEVWTPVPSDVAIPFRVHFPPGTPENESARLVVEASAPIVTTDSDDPADSLRWFLQRIEPVFREVDSAPAQDGEVVQLRLPLEAEEVQVRVVASYLSPYTMPLRGVVPERGIVEVRPQPASVVRVVVRGDLEPGALAGHRFFVSSEYERPVKGSRPDTRRLEFGTGFEAELHGVPRDHELRANGRTSVALPQAIPGEDVELRYALDVPLFEVGRAPDQVWTVGVRPVSTIVGRVVDERGTPIPRVVLELAESSVWTKESENGRFERIVLADAAAGADLEVRVPSRNAVHVTLPDPLPWGRVDVGDVVLVACPGISGRVVLPDGRPVPGFPLAISTSYPQPTYGGQELVTVEDGGFHFDEVAAENVILRGWARIDEDGRVVDPASDADAFEIRPRRVDAGNEDLELVVTRSDFFVAHAAFDDGAPVETVHVAAQIVELPEVGTFRGGGGQFTATLPVVDGRFRWDRLPPGTWKMFLSVAGSKQTWETVRVGDPAAIPSFVIPRPCVLTGIVRAPRGGPVDDTRIVAKGAGKYPATAGTNADGRFRLEQVPAGTYLVHGWRDSARTEEVRVTVAPEWNEPVELALTYPDGPRLTVQVVDGEGRSIPFPWIEVKGVQPLSLPSQSGNAQGVAVYGPLVPGRYTVKARLGGRATGDLIHFDETVTKTVQVDGGDDVFFEFVVD